MPRGGGISSFGDYGVEDTMKPRTALRPLPRALLAIGCWLALLAGTLPPTLAASPDQAPPLSPGQARVWFLRPLIGGEIMDAPMIYANGAPIGISQEGTVFYHDFVPGTYRFDVENCLPQPESGFPLSLAPGSQLALAVESDADDSPECSLGSVSYLRPPPASELAELFNPLTYLGAK
jgi:hypothetical protein